MTVVAAPTLHVTKGHGTQNDFVLLDDRDALVDLSAVLVRGLADRRAGVGGDGVIRVVASEHLPEGVAALADEPAARWFMDYRNADGSVAEMCGNGIRVFARHLVDAGLAEPGTLPILTRAGVRTVQVPPSGDVTAEMGVPAALEASPAVDGRPGTAVSMGNPHVVVEIADLDGPVRRCLCSPPAGTRSPAAGCASAAGSPVRRRSRPSPSPSRPTRGRSRAAGAAAARRPRAATARGRWPCGPAATRATAQSPQG